MAKKPVIAVAFHENISDFYGDALEQSGAKLIYIQPGSDAAIPPWVNGVLLTGGGDPMASLFGEAKIAESAIPDVRRDLFEIELIRNCVAAKLPIFGICRGMQMINIALGGSIHQDINRCYGSSLEHRQPGRYHLPCHSICLEKGSFLHSLWHKERVMVNSCHHQCIKHLAEGLTASAYADDGVIEALEGDGIWGVQYHPERMYPRWEESVLFEYFIEKTKGSL